MQKLNTSDRPAHMLFVRAPLAPMLKPEGDYVSPEYIKKYDIKVRHLDFESGVIRDSKTHARDPEARTFTLPPSRSEMLGLLETTKPWVADGEVQTLHYDESLDDWWHAFLIGQHLNRFLDGHCENRLGLAYDLVLWPSG